ncbi:hypothetical protein JC525_12625 [Alteromonas sp. IB21]|uniref:hypothetical protein n=1 Tax=Alteromonas sp. IB21 TaxID=2779369 RepID=UPI0018E701F4|nr:hypothetical protein [Alteromonas sp. IB21]MBJ2129779.1 hypothetical protein [Alteromonas sp. IB21]
MRRYTLIILLLLGARTAIAQDNIWVVANVSEVDSVFSKADVRTLFMNNSSTQKPVLQPVALSPGHRVRSIFNAKVLALPESRIQSYWAQMRFSGRMTPPKEFETLEEMLEYISNNEGAVGYMPAEIELPEHLIVIYESL